MINRGHIYIRESRLPYLEMGCLKVCRCNIECYAVSEVMSLILVFTIVTTVVTSIMFWGVPYMEERKAETRRESALTQFNTISDIIKDNVIGQGFNSSTVVSFTTEAGQVSLDSTGERFIFYYSLDSTFNFNVSGLGDNNEFTIIVEDEDDPLDLADFIDVYYLLDGYPPDLGVAWAVPFTVSNPLVNAIQIDIRDTETSATVGRIWLFDAGSITYETSAPSGVYKVITENGGVVSGKGDYGYLYDEPNIKTDDDRLAMRIIQLKPGSTSSEGGSGGGKYQFTIMLNKSYIREKEADISKYFKMQISGGAAAVKAWENHFKIQHDFGKYEEGNAVGTLYLDGDRVFTLTHSVCDVYLRVVG